MESSMTRAEKVDARRAARKREHSAGRRLTRPVPPMEHLDALSRHYAALGIVGNQMRRVDHGGGTGR
jgi:hypothetical protein